MGAVTGQCPVVQIWGSKVSQRHRISDWEGPDVKDYEQLIATQALETGVLACRYGSQKQNRDLKRLVP